MAAACSVSPEVYSTIVELGKELNCVICLNLFDDPYSLPCNHQFCKNCIHAAMRNANSFCPLCKLPTFKRQLQRNPTMQNIVNHFKKLQTLIADYKVPSPIKPNGSSLLVNRNHKENGNFELNKQRTKEDTESSEEENNHQENKKLKKQDDSFLLDESSSDERTKRKPPINRKIELPSSDEQEKKSKPKKKNSTRKMRKEEADEETEKSDEEFKSAKRRRTHQKPGYSAITEISSDEKEEHGKEEESEGNQKDTEMPKRKDIIEKRRINDYDKSKSRHKVLRKSSEFSPEKIVIVGTLLDRSEMDQLQKLTIRYGGKLLSKMHPSATHVITKSENKIVQRTFKYLAGLTTGAWIISWEWVEESAKTGYYVHESDFEVEGDINHKNIPEKARLHALSKKESILIGYSAFLYGDFKQPLTKDELEYLLRMCRVEVLEAIPPPGCDLNHVIADELGREKVVVIAEKTVAREIREFERKYEYPLIHLSWLTESISTFSLQDPDEYRLENFL